MHRDREQILSDVDAKLREWRHLPDDSRVTIPLEDLRWLRLMVPPPRMAPLPPPRNDKGLPFPHQHKATP